MAYEYVNENNGVSTEGLPSNLTTLSVSSSETTVNPLILSNNSFSESIVVLKKYISMKYKKKKNQANN